MTVDFNEAPQQGSGAGPIPEDSVVVVVAEIREPKAAKVGTVNSLFCKAPSGYEYLDFEFTVISPKFKDRKIWQNFMLAYTKAPTDKSAQAISISMRTLRAMVEAARKISPKDTSPEATKARVISGFADLNSMLFPVVVGCEWGNPNDSGKRYLNNTIKRIVTPDDERFEKVFEDPEGCLLSNKPLPPEPETAGAPPGGPKLDWGKTAAAPSAQTVADSGQKAADQGTIPGVKQATKPAWVK
jgi:hypothetical protein